MLTEEMIADVYSATFIKSSLICIIHVTGKLYLKLPFDSLIYLFLCLACRITPNTFAHLDLQYKLKGHSQSTTLQSAATHGMKKLNTVELSRVLLAVGGAVICHNALKPVALLVHARNLSFLQYTNTDTEI